MKRVLRSQHDFRSTTLRNQLTSLILYEAVTTTAYNAKLLESFANHFFNVVKPGDLVAKKKAHQVLVDQNAVKKTFEDVLPRYKDGLTTFVRSLAAAPRHGDNAPQRAVMLIETAKIELKPTKEKDDKASKKIAKVAGETK